MPVRQFHPATVVDKRHETDDSIVLTLQVDESLKDDFRYRQGQHLPLRVMIDGKSERRTYSICSSVADDSLRLGVRVQPGGVVSNHLADVVGVGDTLDVMPPFGHFYTELDPGNRKIYAAFVAGSGITPILSIAKTALETEAHSEFLIFYGNRKRATTMFIEDLWALKNRFPDRLTLTFILSREPADIELLAGRIDADKLRALHAAFLERSPPDEIYLCGPNPMIDELTEALVGLGYDRECIHAERFRPGLKGETPPRPRPPADAPEDGAEVVFVMDGHRQSFHMSPDAASIVDAAADSGIDLPYSCKGGVCSTCRTQLKRGKVDMAVNYALEPWELEQGFILACQSRPLTKTIELDYDQT
ncbi:MAG: FAD-binding oxidoreductase [Woeseiaceae bacterium]|nr:FAD-binding oxidoreductase [Woeseiaceae bacterium]